MNYREEKVFKTHDYEIETTADLSPTLRPEKKESMHHMGGAAGESVYIYYEAMKRYHQLTNETKSPLSQWHVLSFGFGMGYNEILATLYFLINKKPLTDLQIYSYEKDLFLYSLFNDWLRSETGDESVFDIVFAGIQKALGEAMAGLGKSDLKQSLLRLLELKQWQQHGPVYQLSDFRDARYDVVFYDAYSSKTNDYLWTEEFLNDFFNQKLNSKFVFSTYACTGILKRVASASQAEFIKRDGYKGKRNSSMIVRG